MFQCWFSLDPLGSYVCSQPTLGNQGKDSSYWPGLETRATLYSPRRGQPHQKEMTERDGFPEWKWAVEQCKRVMDSSKQQQQRSHFPAFQRLLYCLLELEAISCLATVGFSFLSLCVRAWLNPWLSLSIFPSLGLCLSTFLRCECFTWLPWSHIQRGFQIVYL